MVITTRLDQSTTRTQGEDRKSALHAVRPLVRSRLPPRTLRAGVTPWQMTQHLNIRQDPRRVCVRGRPPCPRLPAPVCPYAVLRTQTPPLPQLSHPCQPHLPQENPIQLSHDLASPWSGISPADATHKGTKTFAQDAPCSVVHGAQNWKSATWPLGGDWFDKHSEGGI